MQEEANQKTVGIAVQGTKMTGRMFWIFRILDIHPRLVYYFEIAQRILWFR